MLHPPASASGTREDIRELRLANRIFGIPLPQPELKSENGDSASRSDGVSRAEWTAARTDDDRRRSRAIDFYNHRWRALATSPLASDLAVAAAAVITDYSTEGIEDAAKALPKPQLSRGRGRTKGSGYQFDDHIIAGRMRRYLYSQAWAGMPDPPLEEVARLFRAFAQSGNSTDNSVERRLVRAYQARYLHQVIFPPATGDRVA